MTNSNNSLVKKTASSLWEYNQRWRERLSRKATHKALDIPDDGMHITNGLGWKELAVLGAMGLGAFHLANRPTPPPSTPPMPVVATPESAPTAQPQGWRLIVEETEGITVKE